MSRLHAFTPYAAEGQTIAQAIDEQMQSLAADDWGFMMDHDVHLTTPDWHPAIRACIAHNPHYGILTVMTNRCGELAHPWQMQPNVDVNNHDIHYHRRIGKQLLQAHGTLVVDVTHMKRKMNGVAIAIKRSVWDELKPRLLPRESILSFDLKLHRYARDSGHLVGVMQGIYVYHWYRADGVTHIS